MLLKIGVAILGMSLVATIVLMGYGLLFASRRINRSNPLEPGPN
jgi:hypothetical protein